MPVEDYPHKSKIAKFCLIFLGGLWCTELLQVQATALKVFSRQKQGRDFCGHHVPCPPPPYIEQAPERRHNPSNQGNGAPEWLHSPDAIVEEEEEGTLSKGRPDLKVATHIHTHTWNPQRDDLKVTWWES